MLHYVHMHMCARTYLRNQLTSLDRRFTFLVDYFQTSDFRLQRHILWEARKRFLPVYCAWGAWGGRERERERDTERASERRRWRHHCRAKIGDEFCTFPCQKFAPLVLAKSSALFLTKTLHLSFFPLQWRWVHTFRCQKHCTLRNSSHSS